MKLFSISTSPLTDSVSVNSNTDVSYEKWFKPNMLSVKSSESSEKSSLRIVCVVHLLNVS